MLGLDILQVKLFISAATIGNFSIAAEENYISQSCFSKRIMALEDEVGAQLFDRSRRSISLTKAGECFLNHAYKILNDYNNMLSELSKFSQKNGGEIKISLIPILPQYGITNIIIGFRQIHPEINFNISEMESSAVLTSLHQLDCDFGILRTNYLAPGQYDISPLVEDRLVLVTSQHHPIAGNSKISLSELKNEKFILPNKRSDLLNICTDACLQAGFKPNVVYNINAQVETTFALVNTGEVVSLMMKKVVESYDIPSLRIIELEELIPSTTALVRFKSKELTPAGVKFAEFIKMNCNANSYGVTGLV